MKNSLYSRECAVSDLVILIYLICLLIVKHTDEDKK